MNPLGRSLALLGAERLARLGSLRIALVGAGGVGGWCAEALVRTGARHLAVFDDDRVAPSNLNRQCAALVSTIGRPKVEALAERLRAIAPEAEIDPRCERVTGVDPVLGFDVIIDAIDSVDCKAELILGATAAGRRLYSSMGAAKRFDPCRVCLKRFDRIEGDALARALRNRFRRLGRYPAAKFLCAVSEEPPADCEGLGSLMPVVAAFGMTLASAVIADI